MAAETDKRLASEELIDEGESSVGGVDDNMCLSDCCYFGALRDGRLPGRHQGPRDENTRFRAAQQLAACQSQVQFVAGACRRHTSLRRARRDRLAGRDEDRGPGGDAEKRENRPLHCDIRRDICAQRRVLVQHLPDDRIGVRCRRRQRVRTLVALRVLQQASGHHDEPGLRDDVRDTVSLRVRGEFHRRGHVQPHRRFRVARMRSVEDRYVAAG